jgi:hypothetical protein
MVQGQPRQKVHKTPFLLIKAGHGGMIERIMVQGQPRQKVHKTPFLLIKAGHGGMCLPSQLCGKCK